MRRVVAQHFQEQTADHIRDQCFVVAQISHRADRFRQDQQAVGVIRLRACQQSSGYLQADHHAGQVIVDHRRVAQVSDQHEGLLAFAGDDHLADFQRTRLEAGADDHPVRRLAQRIAQLLGGAQAPIALVVFEHEWDRIGQAGMDVQMPQQLLRLTTPSKGSEYETTCSG